jgi:hypothetical protein
MASGTALCERLHTYKNLARSGNQWGGGGGDRSIKLVVIATDGGEEGQWFC